VTTVIASTCDLCGAEHVPVRNDIVRWVDPSFGRYEAVLRCKDTEVCKRRIAANGDAWPVEDPRRESGND
jgi:hypothetical protein